MWKEREDEKEVEGKERDGGKKMGKEREAE